MTTATAVRGKRVRHAETKQPHLSREQRVALGKAARAAVPRAGQAEFTPAPDRPDPAEPSGEARRKGACAGAAPDPLRADGRLSFAYFRGAALPMASDLAGTHSTGLVVQCCGDAHMTNFGVFASPERRLVFDVNDFDETLPGPWEWDVKRLATSIEIAGRDNGYQTKMRRDIVNRHGGRSTASRCASSRTMTDAGGLVRLRRHGRPGAGPGPTSLDPSANGASARPQRWPRRERGTTRSARAARRGPRTASR